MPSHAHLDFPSPGRSRSAVRCVLSKRGATSAPSCVRCPVLHGDHGTVALRPRVSSRQLNERTPPSPPPPPPPPPPPVLIVSHPRCPLPLRGTHPLLSTISNHVCMALMDSVVAASSGKKSMVPKVSMYDVRNYELGRQFPPGHATVEVQKIT